VMLLSNIRQTMVVANTSINQARAQHDDRGFYVESLGLSDEEKRGILQLAANKTSKVDPAVAYLIGATNGIAYKHLIGKLGEYPIPEMRLPFGRGQSLLDIGCNWGRWCIAAARKGYGPIGLDPSLGAIMAAKRVATEEGVDIKYIVGDARFLPFSAATINNVFSYSLGVAALFRCRRYSAFGPCITRLDGSSVRRPGLTSVTGPFPSCVDSSHPRSAQRRSLSIVFSVSGYNTQICILCR